MAPSPEGEPTPSGWTLDTLHAHLTALSAETNRRLDQRFEDQEKAVAAALTAAKEAVSAALTSAKEAVVKAETASEKWQAGANEWRGAMTDRERNFIQRIEYDGAAKALESKVDDLVRRVERAEGRSSGFQAGWALLVGAAGLAASIGAVVYAVTR